MRAYRALLHLYPRSFRHEYGDELVAIVAQRWRDAGPPTRLAIVLSLLPETMADALKAHADIVGQDLRPALRALRRSVAFTATAIVTIALGIGATTAVFSVTDVALVRPLPFREPERLVKVVERTPGYPSMELSPGNYRDWKRMNLVAAEMGTYTTRSVNLVGAGAPERVETAMTSADLLPTLGVAPLLGRTFTMADDAAGAPGTVLLSHAFWQSRFGGDPGVLGRQLRLNDEPFVVIGVLPSVLRFPSSEVALWTPQRFGEESYRDRTDNFIEAIARLRPGVTVDDAQRDFERVAAILEREYPRENERTSASVRPLRGDLSWRDRFLLLALGGAAACVLLIVCANLANLLIARALDRRRELAIRVALGAGWERLLRQLATESVLIATSGGVLGIALAALVVPLLTKLVPVSLPAASLPSIDGRVLLFAAGLIVGTGLVAGVLPTLRIGADVDASALAEGARAGGGARERLRSVLVVAEVAASVALLVAAGLLLRALWKVQTIDPGFRTTGVLTLRTDLPQPRYGATAARVAFYDRVLDDVRALPGVVDAGYISGLPMVRGGGIWPVSLAGKDMVRDGRATASLRFITPGYLGTMGIPLRRGRDVRNADTADRRSVAVVSESFARRHWPDADPIGQMFTIALAERTVVGVVGDVKVRGLERESEPQVYLSYAQVPDGWLIGDRPNDLAVEVQGDPAAVTSAIREIIRKIDPLQPVSDVSTIDDIVALNLTARATQLRVLAMFAGLALLLAGVGLHGVLAYAVAQRTQEIGVRMALGARPSTILSMVVSKAVRLVLIGAAIGCGIAYVAGKAMEAVLAGISPSDGLTYAVVLCLAPALALAGTLVPAIRASRVDPVIALRT